MDISLKSIKWKKILLVYGIGFLLTYLATKLPNFLQKLSVLLFDFKVPFNWNHGVAIFISAIIGYHFFNTKKRTKFLGNNKTKSVLFALVPIIAYSINGISNNYNINIHFWGFIFIFLTLLYDILEETFWRGYLKDAIPKNNLFVKYILTGILWAFWHVLIFDDFNQWGGFGVYLLLSIMISFIIGYATTKTNSILVASAIHSLLILKSIYVTIICLVVWVVIFLTWNRKLKNI